MASVDCSLRGDIRGQSSHFDCEVGHGQETLADICEGGTGERSLGLGPLSPLLSASDPVPQSCTATSLNLRPLPPFSSTCTKEVGDREM